LKAFYFAVSLLVLSLPAAADEALSSAMGAQMQMPETAAIYRLEFLRKKIPDEKTAVAAVSDKTKAADAEFGQKVRAMLELAREEVRRAAQGPNPVDIRVRVRCVSKRIVTTSGTAKRAFVPALAWAAAEDAPAPAMVTRKTAKACRIQLITTPSKRPNKAPSFAQGNGDLRRYMVDYAPAEAQQ
jgi:hypothetical protein